MRAELESLVAAVVRDEPGAAETLAEWLAERLSDEIAALAEHRSARVRATVARALVGRNDEALEPAARRLAADASDDVRVALAEALALAPAWGQDELVTTLLRDEVAEVRRIVLNVAAPRTALRDELVGMLTDDEDEDVRARLAPMLAAVDPARAVPPLIENLSSGVSGIQRASGVALLDIVRRFEGWPPGVKLPPRDELVTANDRLRELGKRRYAPLIELLARDVGEAPPNDALRGKGTDLLLEYAAGKLERAFGVEREVDALAATLRSKGPRAALLLGEPGTGKTAIVHELVHRLAHDDAGPWRVIRLSPSEFVVGTKYLGEWQTKVQALIDALKNTPRSVLYIPSLHELASIGTWERSDENVASMLAPSIENGSIAVIGESTPAEFAAGLGRKPSLRRLWKTIEVPPKSTADTKLVLRALCAHARVEADDTLLARVIDYSEMFSASSAQPGRAAELLRRVIAAKPGCALQLRDVLEELSKSTGVPLDLVDDGVALDLDALRAFVEARVIGQREAVDAVVDLVTLLKAGLNDPHKPLAVLFFVGPTGVGKTELARALAERIFGDPARLLRFDMSEYASYESYERLIGNARGSGTLASAVRETPFSVVLLDEIEKAHANVFDLCLQVFDAGRLTDGAGRTVDFRRSIVILTSNVGALVPLEGRLGFADTAARAPEEGDVLRALRDTFRPEFLNRIDRIVCFRPLALETAERIAQRELARVLERGGIERRGLAVDVAPEVVALLLRLGYSHAYGARPLKRAIERAVLTPVARVIASGRARAGSVLRLGVSGDEVEVEIAQVDDAGADAIPQPSSVGLERVRQRAVELLTRTEDLERRAEPLRERKSQLVELGNAAEFWNDRTSALRSLDDLHRIDGVLARVERTSRDARACAEWATRARDARAAIEVEASLGRIELDQRLAARLLDATETGRLADALVVLTRVKGAADSLDAVEKLARMYQAWATRRRFEVTVLGDRRGGDPVEDEIVLAIRGAGAFALLARESGLHAFHEPPRTTRSRKIDRGSREIVRVDVLALREAELDVGAVTLKSRTLASTRGRLLAHPKIEVSALHERGISVRLWTDLERPDAERVASEWLAALVHTDRRERGSRDIVVRRYDLGASPRVRDRSSGEATGKLAKVLAGEIDAFLLARTDAAP